MTSYVVAWFIDAEGDDPRDAVLEAKEAQADEETTANVFHVRLAEELGHHELEYFLEDWTVVDLDEKEED